MHEPRWPAAWVALLIVAVVGYWAWDPVRVSPREVEDREEPQTTQEPLQGEPSDPPRERTRVLPEIETPRVIDPLLQPAERAPETIGGERVAAEPERYTVRAGDTLSGIAFRVYGSTRYVDLIFDANRDVLRSKDALAPGQELVMPELPEGSSERPDGGSE